MQRKYAFICNANMRYSLAHCRTFRHAFNTRLGKCKLMTKDQ